MTSLRAEAPPRAFTHRGNSRSRYSSTRGYNRSRHNSTGTDQIANGIDPFEKERSENAAKREQKGQTGEGVEGRGGRGSSSGRFANRSVRFASSVDAQAKPSTSSAPSPIARSAFGSSTKAPRGAPLLPGKALTAPKAGPSGASPATQSIGRQGRTNLAADIDDLLRKNKIRPPSWPAISPGDPSQKGAMETFRQAYKDYRAKARDCLIRSGFIDDPEKPKKLSEAIDFRGTCEGMCPEFEKVTRIVEHDVKDAEKELAPDGKSSWPSPAKMIKKLARSAAGQDAPLPEDVRSPAALRRTLDYLIDTVLGDNELADVHGFLWDRTRAIRRDFVFQQSSMTADDLADQIYCLELIARFHVTALHQMSQEGMAAEDFSEQQEVEQLGKALLSLVHAYEDSAAQGLRCENESEFRAYYVLFNSHNTGILEAVQDWGYNFWQDSTDLKTAVALVEAMQNIWDGKGPLTPHFATNIAQNNYHRFFSTVENPRISYTMACFAEIHFNKVRKAALKTILAGYRKQKDQTRDWTLDKLNSYLHFDDEEQLITFAEAYGLRFDDVDGELYLSFDSDDQMIDPFPQLKQIHSKSLVERKRGNHTLAEVIRQTYYEEDAPALQDNQGLFVPDSPDEPTSFSQIKPSFTVERKNATASAINTASFKPASITSPFGHTPAPFPGQLDQSGQTQPLAFPNATTLQAGTPTASVSFPGFSKSESTPQASPFSFLNIQGTGTAAQNSPFSSLNDRGAGTSSQTSPFSFLNNQGSGTASQNSPFSILNSNKENGTAPQASIFGTLSSGGASSTTTPLASFGQPSQSVPRPAAAGTGAVALVTEARPTATVTPAALPPTTAEPTPLAPIPSFTTPLGGSNETSPPAFPSNVPSTLFAVSKGAQENNGPALPDASSSTIQVAATNDEQSQKLRHIPASGAQPTCSGMSALTNWVTLSEGGLLDQFVEYTIENIVRQSITEYMDKERRTREEEEERAAREEAARFRYHFLASKYGRMWRELAHRLWMRRKGKLARQARREMAENSLAAYAVHEAKDLVEEFSASTRAAGQTGHAQRLLGSPDRDALKRSHAGVGGRHSLGSQDSLQRKESSPKCPTNGNHGSSRRNSVASSSSQHSLRRSLLSDSAYLQGGSRLHLLSSMNVRSSDRPQRNGVQTDYFRLKARGIMTLPDGTPLARTAAVELDSSKRLPESGSKIGKTGVRFRASSTRPLLAKSSTPEMVGREQGVGRDPELEALKAKAQAILAGDSIRIDHTKKRVLEDDEDDELLAKAKRIREQMDEDIEWYRTELHNSFPRSAS